MVPTSKKTAFEERKQPNGTTDPYEKNNSRTYRNLEIFFKEPGLLQPVLQGMKKMDTHIRIAGIIVTITCFLLMSSGCTEQNKTTNTGNAANNPGKSCCS